MIARHGRVGSGGRVRVRLVLSQSDISHSYRRSVSSSPRRPVNAAIRSPRFLLRSRLPERCDCLGDEAIARGFATPGVASATNGGLDIPDRTLMDAAAAGIDLDVVTAELEREGARSFCDSCRELLDCIEGKLAVVGAPDG